VVLLVSIMPSMGYSNAAALVWSAVSCLLLIPTCWERVTAAISNVSVTVPLPL
jgi:hypothetical protein